MSFGKQQLQESNGLILAQKTKNEKKRERERPNIIYNRNDSTGNAIEYTQTTYHVKITVQLVMG